MTTQLRTWTSQRGEQVGVNVTRQAVEFWRVDPHNIQYRVSLAQFLYEQVGVDQAEFLVGEEKAVEVYEYVTTLMEANRDYVDSL